MCSYYAISHCQRRCLTLPHHPPPSQYRLWPHFHHAAWKGLFVSSWRGARHNASATPLAGRSLQEHTSKTASHPHKKMLPSRQCGIFGFTSLHGYHIGYQAVSAGLVEKNDKCAPWSSSMVTVVRNPRDRRRCWYFLYRGRESAGHLDRPHQAGASRHGTPVCSMCITCLCAAHGYTVVYSFTH